MTGRRTKRALVEDALLIDLNSHRERLLECANFMNFWESNVLHQEHIGPSTVRLYYWPSPDARYGDEYGSEEEREYLQNIAFYIDTLTIRELEPDTPKGASVEELRAAVRQARGILVNVIGGGSKDRHLGSYLFPEQDIRNPSKHFTRKDIEAAIKHNEEN